MKAGDILGIQGKGWLSDEIRALTGDGPLSHVGIITAVEPFPQVTEALTRVRTRPLDLSIADAEHAWLLEWQDIVDAQRLAMCQTALSFSADDYGYVDIGFQLLDSVFKTRWITQHFVERKLPICSLLDALAAKSADLNFGVTINSTTPNDIWTFAVQNPQKLAMRQEK